MAAAGSVAWLLIGRERSRVLLVYCVDPCAGVECSVGQVCQLDPQTRRALRRTERVVANCRFCCMAPDWSRAVTCVLMVYCVDPCAGVECSVGQVCQLDPQTRRALRKTERVVENCRFCCMAPDWSRAVTCSTGVLCRPVCRRGVFSRPGLSTIPSNTSCSVSLRRYRPRRTMSYDPSTSLCVGRSHLRERVSDEGHCLQATTS